MKKFSRILAWLPEYYLIVVALLSGYTPPFSISAISVGLTVILILQVVFKNTISGILIAILFTLVNIYMLFALVSEFNEFATFSTDAKRLLLGGLSLFILNLTMSGMMIFRYTKNQERIRPQAEPGI